MRGVPGPSCSLSSLLEADPLWCKKDSLCELPPLSLYESALQSGTRLVDTAYIYGTEPDIGNAFAKSKLKRSEYFVITKPMTDAFKRKLHVAAGNIRFYVFLEVCCLER